MSNIGRSVAMQDLTYLQEKLRDILSPQIPFTDSHDENRRMAIDEMRTAAREALTVIDQVADLSSDYDFTKRPSLSEIRTEAECEVAAERMESPW